MNKKQLSELVAEKHGMSKKQALVLVNDIFDAISEKLIEGETVEINNFGKFRVKECAERIGIIPKTQEITTYPASKKVVFRVSKVLKRNVAK